jgi:hypothetical protein
MLVKEHIGGHPYFTIKLSSDTVLHSILKEKEKEKDRRTRFNQLELQAKSRPR